MSSFTTHKTPHVTHFPTLTGGVGPDDLQRFYDEYFLQDNPPSTRLTLLSRTIGADRVVDEIHLAFKHTHEMPWLLPGVAPTGKRVEVLLVSIVNVRGGKLYSEHVYWDQASVLMQTGLLDPRLIPQKAKRKFGVEELPVVGKAAARRALRGAADGADGQADNELLPGWYDDDDDDEDDEDDEDEDEEEEEEEDGEEENGEEEDGQGEAVDGDDSVNGDGAVTQGNGQKKEVDKGRKASVEDYKASGTDSGAEAQERKKE